MGAVHFPDLLSALLGILVKSDGNCGQRNVESEIKEALDGIILSCVCCVSV